MINVTKTFLPPKKDYTDILKHVWNTGVLTNRGDLVNDLESKLKAYLGVPHILSTTNGTLPLQIAIKVLGLTGEIITTPFSYVATTSSIVWEGCKPVFVEVHPEYLTIDAAKIEQAVTSKTSAILATHVFGNPCDVEAIEVIAKRHKLKVIYDAAHCFGVTYNSQSIFNYGDVSTCSFHATKLFHTGEGGALFYKAKYAHELYYHHNFGHDGPEAFHGLGINAKMSELQAAMGLAVLPYMESILKKRKEVVDYYKANLEFKNYKGLKLRKQTSWNYSYFPIIFDSEMTLLKTQRILNQHHIMPRRYFYPSLNTLPYVVQQSMPISEKISRCILCLPLYVGLTKKELELICTLINAND